MSLSLLSRLQDGRPSFVEPIPLCGSLGCGVVTKKSLYFFVTHFVYYIWALFMITYVQHKKQNSATHKLWHIFLQCITLTRTQRNYSNDDDQRGVYRCSLTFFSHLIKILTIRNTRCGCYERVQNDRDSTNINKYLRETCEARSRSCCPRISCLQGPNCSLTGFWLTAPGCCDRWCSESGSRICLVSGEPLPTRCSCYWHNQFAFESGQYTTSLLEAGTK